MLESELKGATYLIGSCVGVVWDNQDANELQNHDHVVALLIRPDILHRRIVLSTVVQDLLVKQSWNPLNTTRLAEIILPQ